MTLKNMPTARLCGSLQGLLSRHQIEFSPPINKQKLLLEIRDHLQELETRELSSYELCLYGSLVEQAKYYMSINPIPSGHKVIAPFMIQ
jgi:hypothetical protein